MKLSELPLLVQNIFPFVLSLPRWMQIWLWLAIFQVVLLVFLMLGIKLIAAWPQQTEEDSRSVALMPSSELENLVFHTVLRLEGMYPGKVTFRMVSDDVERLKFSDLKSVTIIPALQRLQAIGALDVDPATQTVVVNRAIVERWEDPYEEPLDRWPSAPGAGDGADQK